MTWEIEMKRKNYEIRLNGELVMVKHAWNASCKAIESLVKDMANQTKQNFTLIEIKGEKNVSGYFTGSRVWQGSNGALLNYTINLVA